MAPTDRQFISLLRDHARGTLTHLATRLKDVGVVLGYGVCLDKGIATTETSIYLQTYPLS